MSTKRWRKRRMRRERGRALFRPVNTDYTGKYVSKILFDSKQINNKILICLPIKYFSVLKCVRFSALFKHREKKAQIKPGNIPHI